MKKILFPTDFSDVAENAFLFGLNLADRLGASVITLHAFNRPDVSNVELPPSLQDVYDSIDLDEFENYEDAIPVLRDVASDNGYYHVPMVHVLEEGAPVSAILRTANRNKVDLIVMGATGSGAMKAFFFGTISGKTLEEAHCPVVVVPSEVQFDGEVDHLAVATHFTEEDGLLIEALRKFRDTIGAVELHIVHIDNGNDPEAETKLNAFCNTWSQDKKLKKHCVKASDVNDGLEQFVAANKIDLLALLSEKRSWFDELFQKNRAKELSYHQSIPLLVFQKENLIVKG